MGRLGCLVSVLLSLIFGAFVSIVASFNEAGRSAGPPRNAPPPLRAAAAYPPADRERGPRITLFAALLNLAVEAEAHCSMNLDKGEFTRFRLLLNMSESDESFLEREIPRLKLEIQAARLKIGDRAWCKSTIELIGPRGEAWPKLLR